MMYILHVAWEGEALLCNNFLETDPTTPFQARRWARAPKKVDCFSLCQETVLGRTHTPLVKLSTAVLFMRGILARKRTLNSYGGGKHSIFLK